VTYSLGSTIRGSDGVTAAQIIAAVHADPRTCAYDDSTLSRIATAFEQYAAVFGLGCGVSAGQSCHETGFYSFGGDVKAEQFNLGGIGATGGVTGHSWNSPEDGVIAYYCHAACYVYGNVSKWPSAARPYRTDYYNPRYTNVVDDPKLGGQVIVIGDYVNGRWAETQSLPLWTLANGYAQAIVDAANAIAQQHGAAQPMQAQIAGFAWQPADLNHYEPGRAGQKIHGGAQHYSAGTSSLAWLTTQSPQSDPVSATFLVKHNPTMNDRGWQMVRIEDTPWATNFANHYTIAIEYECLENEAIPDIAYEVLAQTWADIHAYLKQHPDLGAIALDRTTNGIRGHREWVGDGRVCPDGVSVDRIVARAAELANTPLPPPVTDMVTVCRSCSASWGSGARCLSTRNCTSSARRSRLSSGSRRFPASRQRKSSSVAG
jgi:hypothetical protein